MRSTVATLGITWRLLLQGGLVPVPAALLQGSLALGSVVQSVVGEVRPGGSFPVHPLLIAGWVGLVSTAFNLLPVGCIDGGRMCQVPHNPSSSSPFPKLRQALAVRPLESSPCKASSVFECMCRCIRRVSGLDSYF